MYLVHYTGDVLGVDVNKPLREMPTHIVTLGLLVMLVSFAFIYAIVLQVARAIFTMFRV